MLETWDPPSRHSFDLSAPKSTRVLRSGRLPHFLEAELKALLPTMSYYAGIDDSTRTETGRLRSDRAITHCLQHCDREMLFLTRR